jgi:hypothetical protein
MDTARAARLARIIQRTRAGRRGSDRREGRIGRLARIQAAYLRDIARPPGRAPADEAPAAAEPPGNG